MIWKKNYYSKSDKKNNPILFVLFPGVDPTDDVKEAAAKIGKTLINGKFLNISI